MVIFNTTPAYRAAAQSYDGEYTLSISSWRRFPVVLEGMLDTKWLIEKMYGQIRCANCGEQPDKWIYATLAESSPLKGGRGSASLVAKCKMCSRENSLDIIADSIASYDTNEAFKTIVVFDCRGLEPVDFSPRVGFQAKGEATFDDVSLTDLEWTEYDEKANQPVSILEIEHKFIKL